uniref:Uncharacterized protein n=1 Tax=Lepeophtheirus salmonis TaxID=72036 RepID=A0A0K2UKI2_LEPSM
MNNVTSWMRAMTSNLLKIVP